MRETLIANGDPAPAAAALSNTSIFTADGESARSADTDIGSPPTDTGGTDARADTGGTVTVAEPAFGHTGADGLNFGMAGEGDTCATTDVTAVDLSEGGN